MGTYYACRLGDERPRTDCQTRAASLCLCHIHMWLQFSQLSQVSNSANKSNRAPSSRLDEWQTEGYRNQPTIIYSLGKVWFLLWIISLKKKNPGKSHRVVIIHHTIIFYPLMKYFTAETSKRKKNIFNMKQKIQWERREKNYLLKIWFFFFKTKLLIFKCK